MYHFGWFSLGVATTMISKIIVQGGLIRPQHTLSLCVSPSHQGTEVCNVPWCCWNEVITLKGSVFLSCNNILSAILVSFSYSNAWRLEGLGQSVLFWFVASTFSESVDGVMGCRRWNLQILPNVHSYSFSTVIYPRSFSQSSAGLCILACEQLSHSMMPLSYQVMILSPVSN